MARSQTLSDQWQQVRVELQLQMTKATFDTWVKPTFAISLTNNLLVIGVSTIYGQQWLHARLRGMIERAVLRIFERELEVDFIVGTAPSREEAEQPDEPKELDPQPDDLYVEFFEGPLKPFIFVQKYATWFWQPLIGSLAFSTWLMLRTLDKINEGQGKKHRISVDLVAQTLGCHRHSLTGRNPAKVLEGAFGTLNAEKLTHIDVIGKGHDAIYWARVLNSVPTLTPLQLEKLSPLLRERHAIFLDDFRIDAERWEQLGIPTLLQD